MIFQSLSLHFSFCFQIVEQIAQLFKIVACNAVDRVLGQDVEDRHSIVLINLVVVTQFSDSRFFQIEN